MALGTSFPTAPCREGPNPLLPPPKTLNPFKGRWRAAPNLHQAHPSPGVEGRTRVGGVCGAGARDVEEDGSWLLTR